MRIVALEEHFTVPSIVKRISEEAKTKRGFRPRNVPPGKVSPLDLLPDLGEQRLAAMDKYGVTQQVISMSGPGAELVDGQDGVTIAKELNDALADACRTHPKRFAGFAHLPLRSPEAAARELERCIKDLGFVGLLVNGTTEDLFLDDPRFEPILAAAEQLDVPLYIHPSLAPQGVRDIYYSRLPGSAGMGLESASWGWHSETAIHTLRLVFSGALDKHRKLKVIIGHMGEGLPVMLARIDDVAEAHIKHLSRSVSQTILDQVWITTSGVFTQPSFVAALMTFGLDRILFSIDYPYSDNKHGRAFLDSLSLSPADLAKLAHGNADQLLKLKA
jgi:predicted TIM-barrel fold metal-dependent hydrolase